MQHIKFAQMRSASLLFRGEFLKRDGRQQDAGSAHSACCTRYSGEVSLEVEGEKIYIFFPVCGKSPTVSGHG